MSIIGRLIQIGRAYFQSGEEACEEELRKWEEEVKRRQSPKDKSADKKIFPKELVEAFCALEVDIGANFDICKKAYRELANKYHPDRWHEASKEKKENAEKLFKLISEAFIKIKNYYSKKP